MKRYTLTALVLILSFVFPSAVAHSGISYIYDQLGRLKAVVDPASDAVIYNYDAVGNLLSISRQSSSLVSVIEFTPHEAPVGGTVAVYGTAFDPVPAQNQVDFNGTGALVVSATQTELVVTVPSGATDGPISVTTPAGSNSSAYSFTVTTSDGAPEILDFSPLKGPPGTVVTITGNGFDTSVANNKTRFNKALAFVSASSATSIVGTVPSSIGSGRVSVTTPSGTGLSGADFFLPPWPYTDVEALEFTDRMSIGGGSKTATISTAGHIAVVLFEGNAGQVFNRVLSDVTIPLFRMALLKPDGSVQYDWTVTGDSTFHSINVPVDGTYAMTVDPDRRIVVEAGTGVAGYNGEGTATSAQLNYPRGVAIAADGNLYIADTNNHRIRLVKTNGRISTVAGNGTAGFSGDGGKPTNAQLNAPHKIALDGQDNLLIADTNNGRIRKVTWAQGGKITTVAQVSSPRGVAVDANGNIYVSTGHFVKKVDPSGTITNVAGTGTSGYSGDGGPATSARLYFPAGLAVDGQGQIFIADSSNHRIRKVDTAGIITTVAGNGSWGDDGDGGQATNAQMKVPTGVAVDGYGNFFFSEFDGQRIRKVNAGGMITTVAGTGFPGFNFNVGSPARKAMLNFPSDVAVQGNGDLHIADMTNQRIRLVEEQATTGSVTITLTSQ